MPEMDNSTASADQVRQISTRVRQSASMGSARSADQTRLSVTAHHSGGVGPDRRATAQPVPENLPSGELPPRTQRRHHRRARRLAEAIWHVWSKDVMCQEPANPGKESGSHKDTCSDGLILIAARRSDS